MRRKHKRGYLWLMTYAPKSNAAKDYKALVDEIKKGKGNNE